MTTELLTIRDVATRLHTSPRTVQRWVAEGRLRIVRFGKRPLVTDRELEAFIAQGVTKGRERRA